ncbi:MAG TPA: enoyl-CoA hydratase/isomerase family protein [Desulfobacterales bacterium]|jgi:enoyl-CoA hydratase|nr:enoyl-CoA hydratase/isomerase family protein [Desulfobacterales bacterium]
MEFETVIYEKKEQVAVVTLNRPKVLNAMNKQLWLDLREAFLAARADDEVRVVILTGQGRAFSTGADLKDSRDRTLGQYRDYLNHLQEMSRLILRFEKPTIAAVNGYALGSGYELALACDLRVAAEGARFGSPEAKVSSSVTGGAMRLLPLLVGPGKAKELLFTSETIDGREALRIGLVNQVVADDRLVPAALEMARKIVPNSAFSIRLIKKGVDMAPEVSLEALMDFEIETCLATVSAPERQEALRDFQSRKTAKE